MLGYDTNLLAFACMSELMWHYCFVLCVMRLCKNRQELVTPTEQTYCCHALLSFRIWHGLHGVCMKSQARLGTKATRAMFPCPEGMLIWSAQKFDLLLVCMPYDLLCQIAGVR